MRRALLLFAVVVIVGGGTLIYFGTRGPSQPGFERHLVDLGTSGRPTTTSTVLLPEGTWTFGSGPAGFAVGMMHSRGGPMPRSRVTPDSPIAGTIDVHRAGDANVLEKITVGPTGRFRIDLPVGDYELIGHSLNARSDEIDSRSFAISVGRATPVDLVVIAT